MKHTRLTIAIGLFATAIGIPFGAAAQKPYPARQVTVIVPWPAGGAADFLARLTGQKLSERWGATVVVENRPGAATNLGSELVARAQPDGYTLLMASNNNCVNMTLFKDLRHDTVRDFAPVTNVGLAPNVLVVHPSLPVKTVKELVALAKSKPGALSYGSSGNGSAAHLGAELFKLRAGVDILGVPYKGAAPAVTDLVGGHLQMMITVIPATLPYIEAGRLRAIALATPQRLKEFPDLPTIAESGYPGFESSIWYGIVAPAATPKDLIARLNADMVAVIRTPELAQRFAAQGTYPIADTPEQFAATIKADIRRYADIIAKAGIKAE